MVVRVPRTASDWYRLPVTLFAAGAAGGVCIEVALSQLCYPGFSSIAAASSLPLDGIWLVSSVALIVYGLAISLRHREKVGKIAFVIGLLTLLFFIAIPHWLVS